MNSWNKKYYEVAGREEQPCLYFEKKNGNETFVIDIFWDIKDGKGYYLKLFTRSGKNTDVTPRVNTQSQWGLGLSDPADMNSKYKSGLMSESDIVFLANDIMKNI